MLKRLINRIVEATGAQPEPEPISLPARTVPVFEAYAYPWLESRKKNLSPSTIMDYGSQLKNHLIPKWGNDRLDGIKTLAIRAWVDEMRGNPDLSNRTVRNLYGLLRNIMSSAQADELIEVNPCCLKSQHLPPNESKDPNFGERHIFTKEELLRIIDHEAIPPRWRCLYTLLFTTGVRIGEALALTWDDVLLESDVPLLKVFHSYSSKANVVGSTKTGSKKKIPIHPRLDDEIRWWMAAYELETGESPEGDRLVFPAPRGSTRKHMRSSVVYHKFNRQLISLGMDQRRVHDCRRAFISIATNTEGVDANTIKNITHPAPGEVFATYRETPPAVLQRELLKIDFGGELP